MHYSPAQCDPRAEVVERIDAGDVPKKAKLPVPAIVALHDHGGFYFWFYWGERRMLLDDDPAAWRERPSNI